MHVDPARPGCGWRVPVVPVIGVVFSLWLITFLKAETWLRFAAWVALGLVYFAYSRRRSLLNPNRPTTGD